MLQANESYETARLIQAFEDEPRAHFLNAVRAYAETEDRNRQVRLVEAIIRTSRSVTNDPGIMPNDIQEALLCIMERYRVFGPPDARVPVSYGDARNMIKTFFF